jgi:hypothetical protein
MKTFVLTVMVSLMSVLVSIAVTAAAGYTPKYRVKVQADKHTDFSTLRTYSWMDSHPASIPAIDAQIVSAIERELGALGLAKVQPGAADIVATYASITRTDVNTKSKPIAKDYRPEYSVATLVVSLLEPETLKPLLQMRADRPIASATLDTSADTVRELFRYFPTRREDLVSSLDTRKTRERGWTW